MDTYGSFVSSGLGQKVASILGLPQPATLRRHKIGGHLTTGAVLVGGHGSAPVAAAVTEILGTWGIAVATAPSTSVSAAVVDLSDVQGPQDLETLRALLAPALKTMHSSGRVIVVGRPPAAATTPAQQAASRALEGIVRSVAKEMRSGGTANLVHVEAGGEANIEATLRFLLSGRSAYVSGQVIEVGAASGSAPVARPADWDRPLAGKVVVVTGAARGIGAKIATVMARDGAAKVDRRGRQPGHGRRQVGRLSRQRDAHRARAVGMRDVQRSLMRDGPATRCDGPRCWGKDRGTRQHPARRP